MQLPSGHTRKISTTHLVFCGQSQVDEIRNNSPDIIKSGSVWERLRNLARKNLVSVYLGGISAARIAYQATLIVRRKNGDTRISPYRTSTRFDEIFPFAESILSLVVDGESQQNFESFGQDVQALLCPIVRVEILSVDDFAREKSVLKNTCSTVIIPLEVLEL